MGDCKDCVHFTVPHWETHGRGTCSQPPECTFKVIGGQGYLTVYQDFGCKNFKPKPKKEDQ